MLQAIAGPFRIVCDATARLKEFGSQALFADFIQNNRSINGFEATDHLLQGAGAFRVFCTGIEEHDLGKRRFHDAE